MRTQRGLGRVGRAAGQRVDDAPVVAHHALGIAGRGQIEPAQPVEMAAAPAHQFIQIGCARGFVHGAVKRLVGGDEFLGAAGGQRGLHIDQRCQARVERAVATKRQRAHHFQLDRAAQELRLLGRRQVDAADARGVLGKDVDQTFLAQLHQCIAHRRLAQLEAFGDFGARQGRARRQFEGNDGFAQPAEHLGRCLAGAIELVDCLHRVSLYGP